MIKKSKQHNSNGRTILNAKLIFNSVTPKRVIDFRSEVRQRLGYNKERGYKIHANNKGNLPCNDLAEYLIKQEFIVPMIGKKGKISYFEKQNHKPVIIYVFEPNLRGLNLVIRAVSSKEMDIDNTIDLRALDSFISHGYVVEKR